MPTEITEYCVALSYTTFSVISRNFVIFLFLVPGINPDAFGIYGGEDEEKTPLNATDTPRQEVPEQIGIGTKVVVCILFTTWNDS